MTHSTFLKRGKRMWRNPIVKSY